MAEINFEEPRKRVGVIAAQSGSGSRSPTTPEQQRTLTALERVFPVRFEPAVATDLNGLDGVLVLGPPSLADTAAARPCLVLPADAERHDSTLRSDHMDVTVANGASAPVLLGADPALARPLRGRAIPESAIVGELALPPAGATVLAGVDGRPVWWEVGDAAARLTASAYPLARLREGEALREHLRPGRFMGLLALVHFLGRVLADGGWKLPPLRASFVVDDPNLHWPSYGYLKYRELASHAVQHGYHMGLATVPLDGWLADRRVTSLLAQNASVLSLLMHGNNHVARELGGPSTDAAASRPIAQALRRIATMERRHGVTVERVMVPPYEACSEAALRAMFRLGIDAACHTLPYPWRPGLPAATALAGWHPAEMVAGGLPVLPRYPLGAPMEEIALRALLGQPLILYGHHDDFAQGLDILAHATSEVNGCGDVRWGSLDWIARGNYATRQLGETLLIRMHSRRISVDVPDGVHALRVLLQEPLGGAAGHCLTCADASLQIAFGEGVGASEPLTVRGPTRIDLALTADRPLRPGEVPSPGVSLWPLIRRAMVEGRDRVQALR